LGKGPYRENMDVKGKYCFGENIVEGKYCLGKILFRENIV
jgi:hypothetical protein